MSTVLSANDIWKIYPNGTIANRGVSLDVQEQTIHAIVGENGAGKTTLMKILFGMIDFEYGSLIYRGASFKPESPHDAIAERIGMVHQHLMLAPELTVADNLVLGTEPRRRKLFYDHRGALRLARRLVQRYELDVPVDRQIKDLPIGTRQRVEILKALYREAELLILDEPTAVLTPQETEVLFRTLRQLRDNGRTILFISHKLDEVAQIADTVTVMRDAQVIETRPAAGVSKPELAELMVGRQIDFERVPPSPSIGEPLLEVRNLTHHNEEGVRVLDRVSFDVHQGEILGVAGVDGNGQTELVRCVTGLLQPDAGTIEFEGDSLTGLTPRGIRERGVAHIPEDRMEDGVAESATLMENMIADRYYRRPYSKPGRMDWKVAGAYARGLVDEYGIVTSGIRNDLGSLSGGNIQKAVVARELSASPSLVVAAQPTRGVDVGSGEQIHRILVRTRDEGKGVILISADLDEVLKLSTRIIVMYSGQINARFPDAGAVTAVDLGPYMLGIKRQEAASA